MYAVFRAAGVIDDKELLTFRRLGSRLQGHPTPVLPWVDVATGSLGQGMPIAIGMALAAKRLWDAPFHVWTLVGDSETAEGSVWEAFDLGGHESLNNVTPIIDVNRLGQRGPTSWSGTPMPMPRASSRSAGRSSSSTDTTSPRPTTRSHARATPSVRRRSSRVP